MGQQHQKHIRLLKIDTQYTNAVVHVNDASRAVTVVGDLLNQKTSHLYTAKLKKDYDEFRTKFLKRGKEKSYISIEEARKRKYKIDWETSQICKTKRVRDSSFRTTKFKRISSVYRLESVF